jgi:choline dehydrogenase-like flavoprotein
LGVASERVHDAVVVGSGAAGGWAAKELCEAGLTVLVLEAGRAVHPALDLPRPAPPERRLATRAIAALGGQRVQMRCAAFNARTRRFFVSDREYPYTTPAGSAFNWFRGRQVGGRLHVWGRIALRLSDAELASWPLDYAELEPYYVRVEDFLGVRRVVRTDPEERFRAAVEAAFPERRVEAARVVEHDPGAVPCTLRAAEATGRVTLLPDAVVRRVSVDPGTGRATGVSFVDRRSREAREARARAVVLCASTIETLRIMLGSTSGRHPEGLGSSSGRLGRFLMDHVMTGIGGPLDGAERAAEPRDPYDRGAVTGFMLPLRGYGIQGAVGRGAPAWYMLAHGEMLPRAENRVSLHPRRRDAAGVPLAHIRCAHSATEADLARDQLEAMRELAGAAGLRVRTPPSGRALDALAFRLARRRLLAPSGAFLPGSAAHELGGAGMGADPGTSVLDPWGRVWDAENVYVTDGASFPTGCWQNVTLTIMALTVRACDRITQEWRAGRL